MFKYILMGILGVVFLIIIIPGTGKGLGLWGHRDKRGRTTGIIIKLVESEGSIRGREAYDRLMAYRKEHGVINISFGTPTRRHRGHSYQGDKPPEKYYDAIVEYEVNDEIYEVRTKYSMNTFRLGGVIKVMYVEGSPEDASVNAGIIGYFMVSVVTGIGIFAIHIALKYFMFL